MKIISKSISVSRVYAPLRVCADMCLYYYMLAVMTLAVEYNISTEKGVYGVVSNMIAPWLNQLLILVGACFVIGFLIVRINNVALRFVLSLLPGLTFFMSPLEPTMLIHAAAWVYYVIYMTVGSFELYVDVYRRRGRLLLFIALILTCLLLFYHFGNEAWYGNTLFGGEVFGLLFFVLIVFAMRGMRLSYGAPAKMRIFDAVHVVALPLILLAGFFLLRGTIPAFTWIIAKITRVLTWLFRLLTKPREEVPIIPDEDYEGPVKIEEEDQEIVLPPKAPDQTVDPGTTATPRVRIQTSVWLWILFAILVLALVYYAIKLIRDRQKVYDKAKIARDRIEKLPREKHSRRQIFGSSLSANVNKIRKVYRSYLQHLRSSDVKIYPSDTSKDVLENTSQRLDIPENAALREVYIAARYGDPNAVTSEQADEAKRCFTVIKGKDLKRTAQ